MIKLPKELAARLMTFLRETGEDEFEIVDMAGLVKFIGEHGKEYPFLFNMLQINEDALQAYFEQTGEVPPGIKMVRTTNEGGNVTRLEVLHGPIPPRSEPE
jgi:hypothetical protein